MNILLYVDNIKRLTAAGAISTVGKYKIKIDAVVNLNIGTITDANDYYTTAIGDEFIVSDIDSVYISAACGYILE